MAEKVKLLDGKAYLQQFEKELSNKLINQRLRSEVARVMEEYFLVNLEIYNGASKTNTESV